jgi:epoxyqueuosine reductase QueG
MIRGTSMKRAKIKGLLRNLMVVAGNSGVKEFLPKLQRFLTHEDEHVRSHAEWANRKLSG